MNEKLEPFWMALVLDKAAETLTVAAFDLSEAKAESSARERTSPDASILCVNITGGAGYFANRISLWLAENDIVGVENTEMVREIASSLKKELDRSWKKTRPTGKAGKRRPKK